MRRPSLPLILSALALAWLVLTLAVSIFESQISYVQFFAVPDLPTLAAHLARIAPVRYVIDLLRALLGAAIFALACLSLGLRILRLLRIPQPSALAYGTTAFVVGEILFALVFLNLLSLYHLSPAISALVLALGFLLGLSPLIAFVRGLQAPYLPADFGRFEKLLLGLVTFVFLSGLLLSSARLGYDAVTSYFSHAKIAAMSGQAISFHPDPFLTSSLHPGVLFTALIQLFGDQSARLLPWLSGLAILLLALSIAEHLGLSPRARLWFLALLVTTTAFVDLLGDGKIELIATAPILAAVYWMHRTLDEPAGRAFALIGLLAGYAMIARPYNVFLLGLFMALFYAGHLLLRFRAGRMDLKPLIRSGLWILPPLLALGLFHFVQRGIWQSSLIPEAAAVPAAGAPPSELPAVTAIPTVDPASWQWQFDPSNLVWYRLLYPFVVTFSNTPQSLGTISPLLLGLLPLLLIRNARWNFRLPTALLLLTLSVSITLSVWITFFFTVVELRYVLFIWVLLFIPSAWMIHGAMERSAKVVRTLVSSLLLVLLAYMGARTTLIALDTYSPVDGHGQAHCYDLYLCTSLDPLNRMALPGERVFALTAYRYYLRPDLFACSSRAAEFQSLAGLARQNSPDLWVEIYRQGFDYLAYDADFAESRTHFGTIPDPALAPPWLTVRTVSALPETGEYIYRLDAVDPPFEPETSCVQGPGGKWLVEGGQD